ncbi:hypothetical protein [Sediminitomix flava]|uniref:DUF5034 domain-containing protein n=1 Tax=Sediminitomix flava TaxID=379075 RepID=A0A315ZJV4_SEDFL|nr:hypothetical protein [Sediminitomix flava]PWJ34191.1 hypothetical protein BC781_111101 [Sediminitomix flava]
MKNRFLKSLILLIISFLPIRCTNCNCDNEYRYFDITDMSAVQYNVNDQSGFQTISNGQTVNITDFRIGYKFDTELLSAIQARSFSLTQEVFACDCYAIERSKEERFVSLSFITNYDFDENHQAGSSINDLLQNGSLNLEEYLNYTEPIVFKEDIFELKSPPTLSNKFKFTVIATLSNGEIYSSESEEVTIQAE